MPAEAPVTAMQLWGSSWLVRGSLVWTNVPVLPRPVHEAVPYQQRPVTIESAAAWSNAYAVEALVRFHQESAATNPRPGRVTLSCGVEGTNTGYTLAVGSGRQPGAASRSFQFGGGTLEGVWDFQSPAPRFTPDDISPVMEEEFRLRLENDFGRLPESRAWHRLRLEVRPAQVRVYVDGLLSGYESNRMARAGAVQLQVHGPALLAGLEVTPLPAEAGRWVTAPLDGLCNASGFVERASLNPPASCLLSVGEVPFLLPNADMGFDHMDVGVSLYRYNRQWGYEPASKPPYNHPGPERHDPAQLAFRVPHAAYRRAWVLAASDGAPNSTPALTVRFFKPGVGWDVDAARAIPEWSATNAPADARRLEVRMKDGSTGALWAVPIELDSGALAGDYRDQGLFTVELTKETHDFVAYPDPCSYGSFQGGLPSGARVYGLTFETAPVSAYGTGEQRGNLYPHPEKARWFVELASQSAQQAKLQVQVRAEGPLGTVSTQRQEVALAPGARRRVEFAPTTREWGLYRVQTTVTSGDWTQSRQGTFLMLPPDKDRKATAKTSRWGLYPWGGAHGTEADPAVYMRQMRALGVLIGAPLGASNAVPGKSASALESRAFWDLAPVHSRIVGRGYPAWAKGNPPDPAARRDFIAEVASNAAGVVKEAPDIQYFNCFAEDSISLRMTHGLPTYAFGQPWFEYTDSERERIRGYYATALAAAEGVKQGAPGRKFILGHCSPDFFLPLFREPDWNPEPFDGFGLDQPQFERMPERPPRATEPSSLYFLYKEMKDRGLKKELVHLESYFPSSHRLALGHRRQADSIVRTAALSLSWGTTKFIETWSLADCSGQWGSQHYGCVGLIGRAPEYNPKPAAAAFATMSRVLDLAEYDGFLDVGSRSAYCLRFKDPDGKRLVYAAWTFRGQRPLALTVNAGAKVTAVDENGNETVLKPEAGACSVTLSPTPLWLVLTAGTLERAVAGMPVYAEAPGTNVVLLDDFEKADWTYNPDTYAAFASNHWDVVRETVAMKSDRVRSDTRTSMVWRVAMATMPEGKPMVGFYGVFTPPKPVAIPGKARALGLMGRGTSAWNRVVFELQDAKGEFWRSIGTKDAWNCDDTHSRSYFNFDGWRYMEFPLPGTLPADNYREKDTVWWGSSDDGVVDLPLRLTRVIVETRTHQVYANEMLPILDSAVEMDNLVAVYDSPELMTDQPVKVQKTAASALAPRRTGEGLPNPIAELVRSGVGDAPEIVTFQPPDQQNDGTKVNVAVKPVPGARQYKVWVAAYPDGRGAKALAAGMVPGTNAPPKGVATLDAGNPALLVRGLKPSVKFYFYVTTVDEAGRESKPSKVRETILRDEFPMK